MTKLSYICIVFITGYCILGSFANSTGSTTQGLETEVTNVPKQALKSSNVLSGGIKRKPRILNGSKSSWNQYNWLGQLYLEFDYVCVVFLITWKHFMSAGHCLRRLHEAYIVQLADFEVYDVKTITLFSPTFYVPGSLSVNNIGIGELEDGPTLGEAVTRICLASASSNFEESVALMAGWGAIEKYGHHDQPLHAAVTHIKKQQNCVIEGLFNIPIGDDKYCVGSSTGLYRACKGDDGGPLMVRTGAGLVAAGVITDGLNCDVLTESTISTRINNYLTWAKDIVGEEELCIAP